MAESRNVYKLDDVLPPHAREALGHLELFARRAVQGWIHGAHPSRRLGVSTEFDHHKLYHPGDPLKSIDWKASARHDRYYIKRSIEDSALAARLVVDRSASMNFAGEDAPPKYLNAARLAACLAYLVISHGDSAGLTMPAADQTLWLPAGSTQRHLVALLTALASRAPGGAGDALSPCLRAIVDRNERRSIIAVVSDLMFYPAPPRREIARLRAQGHEVILFHIRDDAEEQFPFNRWVEFGDLENPGTRHRVDGIILQRLYREEYDRLADDWLRWCRKYDIHRVVLRSHDHVDAALSAYAAFRAGHGEMEKK
jgi:uncharacterized protein (DUF58 family)